MNDKQRAEFEKWYASTDFWKMENSMAKKIALDSWQAAIASVVVELPAIEKAATNEHPSELVYIANYVHDALKSAGVRYE